MTHQATRNRTNQRPVPPRRRRREELRNWLQDAAAMPHRDHPEWALSVLKRTQWTRPHDAKAQSMAYRERMRLAECLSANGKCWWRFLRFHYRRKLVEESATFGSAATARYHLAFVYAFTEWQICVRLADRLVATEKKIQDGSTNETDAWNEFERFRHATLKNCAAATVDLILMAKGDHDSGIRAAIEFARIRRPWRGAAMPDWLTSVAEKDDYAEANSAALLALRDSGGSKAVADRDFLSTVTRVLRAGSESIEDNAIRTSEVTRFKSLDLFSMATLPDPTEPFIIRETLNDARESAGLSATQSRVYDMVLEGMTHQEIADKTHMPKATIDSHVRRAKRKIQAAHERANDEDMGRK